MKYKNVMQKWKKNIKREEESEGGLGPCEKINSSPAENARQGEEGRGSGQLSQ